MKARLESRQGGGHIGDRTAVPGQARLPWRDITAAP